MLKSNKKRESFIGRLLLSSALVAVSLAYGWWQRQNAAEPALAMMPPPSPPAPNRLVPVPDRSAMVAAPAQLPPPDIKATSGTASSARKTATAQPPEESVSLAKAAPQTKALSATPAAPETPAQSNDVSPSSAPPPQLTVQQALQMNLPTDGVSPPMPLVTGAPEAGAGTPAPAGAHLQDGDYVSDRQELAWGDLRVKISVHGGLITGVQILQYPDHRSQSLYLSQMAGPVLESEVIKSQKSQVDVVSSATDTSYAFQDTVANAIIKATRE